MQNMTVPNLVQIKSNFLYDKDTRELISFIDLGDSDVRFFSCKVATHALFSIF